MRLVVLCSSVGGSFFSSHPCVCSREVTLEKYLGKGKKILLVLIRQFSCLLCRLHLKDLRENQANTRRNHIKKTFLKSSHRLISKALPPQTRLDERSVEVVVVSFGCQEGASHWLQETGCQYHMLLDPGKKVRGQALRHGLRRRARP